MRAENFAKFAMEWIYFDADNVWMVDMKGVFSYRNV